MTAAGIEVAKVKPALRPKNTFAAVNNSVMTTPSTRLRIVSSVRGSAAGFEVLVTSVPPLSVKCAQWIFSIPNQRKKMAHATGCEVLQTLRLFGWSFFCGQLDAFVNWNPIARWSNLHECALRDVLKVCTRRTNPILVAARMYAARKFALRRFSCILNVNNVLMAKFCW
jgi:hypothetical protein